MGTKLSLSDIEKKIFERSQIRREERESIDHENLQIIQKQMEWMRRQNRIFERTSQPISNSDSPDPGGHISISLDFNQILRRSSLIELDQEYEVKLMNGTIVKIRESELITRIKSGENWRISKYSKVKIGTRLGDEYIFAEANQYTEDNILNLPTY